MLYTYEPKHCVLLLLNSYSEFGMKDDLRKMEVAGVSSRELYVKRKDPHIAIYLRSTFQRIKQLTVFICRIKVIHLNKKKNHAEHSQ